MVEEAKAAGASVYIVKPLSIKMLAEKVTQVLADAQAAADLDRLIET
jgi:AmiR/NasT family two-component response regulator